MRYHNITKDDMLNGEGLRCVLWLAGCTHACPGCHNPVTWDITGGIPFDEAAKEELFTELKKDYISGITLSGGDPLHPANVRDVEDLVKEIREKFPEKTIWLYTGFCWKDISALSFLPLLDVVVDGRYEQDKRDVNLPWRGSSNQNVIDVQATLQNEKMTLHT